MVARHWRGRSRADTASAYLDHLRIETLPRLRALDGQRGAYVLRREVGDEVEFVVLTLWESLESVRAFAGDDSEAAVVPPVGFVNSVVVDLQGNRAGAREARLADRVTAVTLATAAPSFAPGLEQQTRPAERRRSRRTEHRLDRGFHQRREGRAHLAVAGHTDGTEKSPATAHAPRSNRYSRAVGHALTRTQTVLGRLDGLAIGATCSGDTGKPA
jgi:hypothetical protein